MNQIFRPKILVIDDGQFPQEAIRAALDQEGADVLGARDAAEGLRACEEAQPDLIILDVALPGCDGWEVCRRLRQITRRPIVILTAKTNGADVVRGLNLGADHYMTKPFHAEELRARVGALLRRTAPARPTPPSYIVQAGDVTADLLRRQVKVGADWVRLRPKELDLLVYLMRNADRTVAHEELLRAVWGPKHAGSTRYLGLYICRLRRHIEENPRRPRRIITWRGLGYRFVPVS